MKNISHLALVKFFLNGSSNCGDCICDEKPSNGNKKMKIKTLANIPHTENFFQTRVPVMSYYYGLLPPNCGSFNAIRCHTWNHVHSSTFRSREQWRLELCRWINFYKSQERWKKNMLKHLITSFWVAEQARIYCSTYNSTMSNGNLVKQQQRAQRKVRSEFQAERCSRTKGT